MVVFSDYPGDVRVRREAEALVEDGMQVDLICLRRSGEKAYEKVNGMTVFRVNLEQKRAGTLRYLIEYTVFLAAGSGLLYLLYASERYHVIHVHNMPDFLVFCSIIPRLAGAKVILDLHDPMPEVFISKYNKNISSLMIKLLMYIEKLSLSYANHIITPNISFRNLFISRGCPPEKIDIVMNSPQESVFNSNNANISWLQRNREQGFTLMYHGLIVERHGLDIAIEAVSLIKEKIKGLKFHIYGNGEVSYLNQIQAQVRELGLEGLVEFCGTVSLKEIANALLNVDCGVIPNRMDPFTNLNFPTRIFECLSLGKPVIVPKTQGIMDYFDVSSILFFEPGVPESLAEAILEVYRNPEEVEQTISRAIKVYQKHRWELQRLQLIHLIRSLI